MPAREWVPQWVPEAFSDGATKELLAEYAAIMSDFHPVGFRVMARSVAPDFRELLPNVDASTLLIWGAEDKRSPPSCGEAIRDAVPGSQLVVIPDAGHVSNYEQPVRFNKEVRKFVQSIDAHG
jgi:pimeloyl-ACP methyl ester carboxylesterase